MPRQRAHIKKPTWIIILVSLVCLFLVCAYVYPPQNSAACYVFSSNGCKALQTWLPPGPARELTDDEIASRVVIRDILKTPPTMSMYPKIAFLFLTPGALPFEKLWDKFFQGHEGRFSVYVHASKDKPVHFSRYFINREIRSHEVTWGKISMVDAERRLLGNALKDPDNQHFVLLSDSFEDPGPHGSGRYIEHMLPEVEKKDFRKGSQWFTMKRQHAIIIMADSLYYNKFRDYCKHYCHVFPLIEQPGMEGRNCYSDEHYLPTYFYMLDPAGIANWSVTHVDWSEMKWHPKSYRAQDITIELMRNITLEFYGVFKLSYYHYITERSSFASTVPTNDRLSLRLIHRHSILSPRLDDFRRKSVSEDDIRAPVIPMEDGSIFLVNVSIGEPPIPQLMAMDTGSQLIWVQCTQCDGCSNIFDPQKSSTYTKLSGGSHQCFDFAYGDDQENDSQCSYEINYADKSTSRGVLALEKFTFLTSSGGTIQVPDVVFGCALQTSGNVRDLNGILGLEAPNKYYFTGDKFSYCIGNISDTRYTYNQLIFGDGAVIQGDSTPIRTKNQHYVVTLEGISVGEKKLSINREDFRYNVAIDSGTTYTQLVRSAYEPLMEEVESLMNGIVNPIEVGNAENLLCFSGDLERDLKGFPIVTLHLAEGTDIDLDVEAMFQRTSDGSSFCMAVVESSENMIGVRAQQYYNVGFDLDENRVSFQRIDCELLED
ncbi:hypothetical protein DH2020_034590 [Rehmannia glutinosa]|uniref:Peptidase A1 domain-containing protein n=1 Tax=Rehmannia glutinosa TaxID=99300 RepID=A0ABR0V9P0_REHGL